MAIIMRKGLKINFDPNKMQAGELAVVTDTRELHATFAPGDSPEVLLAPETDGTEGQVLALEDGEPTWKSVASPTDAQVDAAVDDWLDAHPEATTTVQDGAITYAKLDSNLKGTVDDVGELKSDKADSDGTYSTLTAGNLTTEDGANNNTPYLFRASGGGVRVGEREYDKIVGGTVAWNQWTKSNVQSTTTNGVTFTNNGDGSWNISGTASANMIFYMDSPGFLLVVGHKYLVTGCPSGGGANTYSLGIGGLKIDLGNGRIWINSYEGGPTSFQISSGVSVNMTNVRPQIYDLTQMLGVDIANYIYTLENTYGTGIAKLKEWGFFTQPYYPYSAGELKSVEGLTSHDMVGFNQWDEEWEVGAIASGVIRPADNAIRSKNFCKCIGGATYFMTCGKTDGDNQNRYYIAIVFYDADKTYISTAYNNNGTAIAPENAAYFKVTTNTSTVVYGNTYNHDICINLSDPAKNGTYEPYIKHTYPLDDSLTLRGIPKLDSANSLYYDGDTYESDGTVTRRFNAITFDGSNDEGWDLYSGMRFTCRNTISDFTSPSNSVVANIFTDRDLIVSSKTSMPNSGNTKKYIAASDAGSHQFMINLALSTLTEVKAWLSANPLTVIYEVNAPTYETAEPFAAPQIVDQYGTEEYVTTSIVPVGHETFYPENLREKIEGLPWNFASLIAPTEVTYKATQNYTSGSLFIVNNTLYKATANIANGGNITPGTNCQATTLAAVIAAL